MYNIAVTSETKDGKTVYVVLFMDWNKDRKRLKHMLNPLTCLTLGQETKTDIGIEHDLYEKTVFQSLIYPEYSTAVGIQFV